MAVARQCRMVELSIALSICSNDCVHMQELLWLRDVNNENKNNSKTNAGQLLSVRHCSIFPYEIVHGCSKDRSEWQTVQMEDISIYKKLAKEFMEWY